MIAELFLRVAERMGREYGVPLPKRLLEVGRPDVGWHVVLNPTQGRIEDVDGISAKVCWNGWPAGIIDPDGGVLAAGELANERALLAWLASDAAQESEVHNGR